MMVMAISQYSPSLPCNLQSEVKSSATLYIARTPACSSRHSQNARAGSSEGCRERRVTKCRAATLSSPHGQSAGERILSGTLSARIRPIGCGTRRQSRRPQLQIRASSSQWWSIPGDNSWGRSRDEFGKYPWEESAQSSQEAPQVHWVREDVVHLITDEGVVTLGGSRVPRRVQVGGESGSAAARQRKFREEDFMDPQQQLCLGALFDIAATNGLDMGRRFCVLGFCRSVEMLSAVVEDAVREQGGEVVVLEKRSSGLNEKLHLTVAIPLLWGVPPAMDTLNHAIRVGGGIVDKVYSRWEFL